MSPASKKTDEEKTKKTTQKKTTIKKSSVKKPAAKKAPAKKTATKKSTTKKPAVKKSTAQNKKTPAKSKTKQVEDLQAAALRGEEDLEALLQSAVEVLDGVEGEPEQASTIESELEEPATLAPESDGEHPIAKIMAEKTEQALRRKATSTEKRILQERRPYLEALAWRDANGESIVEHNSLLPKDQFSPFLSNSSSTWPIQYWAGNEEYGSLMASSIGLNTYRGVSQDEQNYLGTWRHQAFVTAVEMVVLAQKQGWAGIRIIDGCDFMSWSAWAAAEKLGIPIVFDTGFSEALQDQKKADRAHHLFERVFSLNGVALSATHAPSMAPGNSSMLSSSEAQEEDEEA